jgi:hypothetical protein
MSEPLDSDNLRNIMNHDNKVEHEHQLQVASVGLSEADRAAALKDRAQNLLIELCAIMDEGFHDGLLIRWNGISLGPFTGRHEVVDLHVEKRF